MANNILHIGSPAAIQVDYSTTSVVTHFKDPGSSVTLYDLWAESFRDIKSCQLLLSGGLDSQFSLHLLKTLGVKFDALICDMRWNDVTVNAHDVLTAQRYADLNAIKYRLVKLDLKEFFDSEEYISFGLTYRTSSPQIATQLKMIEIAAADTCVLGGDPVLIKYDAAKNDMALVNSHKGFIINNLCAYYNYANEKNIQIIKDPFKLNPYTNYLSVKHNLDVIQQYNTYFAELNAYCDSNYLYKQHYYNSLGAEIMPPLYKATGFETIKKMLAQKTGIYNQFDKLYRYPLHDLILSQPWAKNMSTKTPGDYQKGKITNILDQAKDLIVNNSMKPCNFYRFDF